MSEAPETQVLIAGAGPIGMTAAIELARRGIACRIVDPLVEPPQYAKAVGVQPQDAHNLAWKLALALAGPSAAGLLESYDAERRPVGEEVVGRTVRSAREGIGADSTDLGYVIRLEAQLLVNYSGGPIVADGAARPATSGLRAGARAKDATGRLTRDAVSGALRLFSLLGRREHTTLLYAPDGPVDVATFDLAAATGLPVVAATGLPVVVDSGGEFARAYEPSGPSAYIVSPDGYLGLAAAGVDPAQLVAHRGATFALAEGGITG